MSRDTTRTPDSVLLENGFLSPKGRGRGDGVKEKLNVNNQAVVNMKFPPPETSVGKQSYSKQGSVPSTVHESPTIDNSAPIRSKPTSYAKLVIGESSRKSVNCRNLIAPMGNEADVAIPLDYIRAVNEMFANTVYGFFFGKRVAYPFVANYVKNTWSKYGLVKSMMSSSNKLFFFQFSSEDGLDAMLHNGLWSSYARAMIELRADEELKDTIVVAMLKLFDACPKKIVSDVVQNLINPRQATTEMIDKFKRQLIEGKLLLVDDDGKPLPKKERKQDDDYDPYDDDLYDSHDMSDNLQAIYDELDITACFDSFGEHAVHCKKLSRFKYRHDMVRDILFDICRCAGISAKKEAPVNFLTDPSDGRSTLRPADVFG
nr:putative reverse transcriptase domain-containing protein [Tanacetum cinerariifolium]